MNAIAITTLVLVTAVIVFGLNARRRDRGSSSQGGDGFVHVDGSDDSSRDGGDGGGDGGDGGGGDGGGGGD